MASLGILSGSSLSLFSFSLSFSHVRGKKKLGSQPGYCTARCPVYSFFSTFCIPGIISRRSSPFCLRNLSPHNDSHIVHIWILSLLYLLSLRYSNYKSVLGSYVALNSSSVCMRYSLSLLPCTFLINNYDRLLHPGCCPRAGL